jgi:hypothetical protein
VFVPAVPDTIMEHAGSPIAAHAAEARAQAERSTPWLTADTCHDMIGPTQPLHAPTTSSLLDPMCSTDDSRIRDANLVPHTAPPPCLVEVCEVPTDDQRNDSANDSPSCNGSLDDFMCALLQFKSMDLACVVCFSLHARFHKFGLQNIGIAIGWHTNLTAVQTV